MGRPDGLRYLPTHEWVKVEGGTATVGITDFAVAEIKDIVYVDLPQPGAAVKAGEPFGAIETVKAAFDLYAPVSGTVREANAALAGSPDTVSKDPFGAGWMLKIDAANGAAEAASHLDGAAYEAHCAAQHH